MHSRPPIQQVGSSKSFSGARNSSRGPLDTRAAVERWIFELSDDVASRLVQEAEENERAPTTIIVSVRFDDQHSTKSRRSPMRGGSRESIQRDAMVLLAQLMAGRPALRLGVSVLGITLDGFKELGAPQSNTLKRMFGSAFSSQEVALAGAAGERGEEESSEVAADDSPVFYSFDPARNTEDRSECKTGGDDKYRNHHIGTDRKSNIYDNRSSGNTGTDSDLPVVVNNSMDGENETARYVMAGGTNCGGDDAGYICSTQDSGAACVPQHALARENSIWCENRPMDGMDGRESNEERHVHARPLPNDLTIAEASGHRVHISSMASQQVSPDARITSSTVQSPVARGQRPAVEWTCSVCTLLNESTANRCAVCDALRGSSLAAAATLAQQVVNRGRSENARMGSARGISASARRGRGGGRGGRATGERGHTMNRGGRGGIDVFFTSGPPSTR